MEPNQIRQREYWGLGSLAVAALCTLLAIGSGLLAGSSLTGVAIGIGIGLGIGVIGFFIIATLPDSEGNDSGSY